MNPNWMAMLPALTLAGTVLLLMLVDTLLSKARGIFPALTALGALATMAACLLPTGSAGVAFNGMLADDGVTRSFVLVIALALFLVSLVGEVDLDAHGVVHRGEYYGLLTSSALGMVLMVASTNLIMTFLGLELFSLALYLLCVFFPRENACQEAGLKYFILSSLASAVMLYGMALLYGSCGSTSYTAVVSLDPEGPLRMLSFVGLALLFCGLAFKLSAVPFHMWTPDVYQGAPTSVAAFMSVATKAAALGALWRFTPVMQMPKFDLESIQMDAPLPFVEGWQLLMALSILSILAGNMLALPQVNLKRMLAYSSIAQAGYLLIGVLSASPRSVAAIVFYLVVYAFMNVGAFAIVLFLESRLQRPVVLDDLNGLARWEPGLAAILSLCLLSLAGLPPAGGLLAKFFLFGAGLKGAGVAVAMGVVGSLLGAYYYLNPIGRMYMREGDDPRLPGTTWAFNLALVMVVLGLLTCGLYPQPVLDWAASAAQALEQAAGPAVTR
ncbi:MAG: NADH-quinone oxidoreductase subunit N [Candidatus Xenobia bacterium]